MFLRGIFQVGSGTETCRVNIFRLYPALPSPLSMINPLNGQRAKRSHSEYLYRFVPATVLIVYQCVGRTCYPLSMKLFTTTQWFREPKWLTVWKTLPQSNVMFMVCYVKSYAGIQKEAYSFVFQYSTPVETVARVDNHGFGIPTRMC